MSEEKLTREEILARYAAGPEQLEAAIAGLSEPELDAAPAAGGWTIRQILHHTVDGDNLWGVCIKAALGNSQGVFSLQWYWDISQDEWADSWNYAGRALEPSLALFRAHRQHIIQLVEQIPDAWERSVRVRWPRGEEEQVTVGDVIEMQANHTLGHIEDIRKIWEEVLDRTLPKLVNREW